jgi:hypothetical protein
MILKVFILFYKRIIAAEYLNNSLSVYPIE